MATKKKARLIIVGHGLRRQIMEALKVSYPTCRAALRYETDTEIARKIRGYAMNHGGMAVEEDRGDE